jgi:hypothetical protein
VGRGGTNPESNLMVIKITVNCTPISPPMTPWCNPVGGKILKGQCKAVDESDFQAELVVDELARRC